MQQTCKHPRAIQLVITTLASASVLFLGSTALAADATVTEVDSGIVVETSGDVLVNQEETSVVMNNTSTEVTLNENNTASSPVGSGQGFSDDETALTELASDETSKSNTATHETGSVSLRSFPPVATWSHIGTMHGHSFASNGIRPVVNAAQPRSEASLPASDTPNQPVVPTAWLDKLAAMLANIIVPIAFELSLAALGIQIELLATVFVAASFCLVMIGSSYGAWLRRSGYVTAARSQLATKRYFATPHRWDYVEALVT